MSAYLLDSHVFLWLMSGTRRLPAGVLDAIGGLDTRVFFSMVGVAELCIKNGLGKLALPAEVERDTAGGFEKIMHANRVEALPLGLSHAAQIRELPRHHRDPFDRLMIAQAMVENLTMVTHDRAFAQYDGLAVLWV